ncbi:MAG TPA: hypothetical protein VGM98_04985, partial [Schlesneria sp.]
MWKSILRRCVCRGLSEMRPRDDIRDETVAEVETHRAADQFYAKIFVFSKWRKKVLVGVFFVAILKMLVPQPKRLGGLRLPLRKALRRLARKPGHLR